MARRKESNDFSMQLGNRLGERFGRAARGRLKGFLDLFALCDKVNP